MKTRMRIPAGSLFAGAAALVFTAAVAVGENPDPQEASEAGQPEEMVNPEISAQSTDRLADHFAAFAGSEDNATALVTGLRDGTAITLTSTVDGQTTTTTITPTTGPMGFGNVFISLALAEEQLTKLGITQPTAEQIQAALVGGSVTTGSGSTAVTTQLTGVLVLRNQGQGWGQVAQSLGVTLRSAIHDARAGMDANETAEAGQPEEMVHPGASARVTDKLADHFATFAGSEDNATALVKGLRDGTAITLTSTVGGQTTTTTITPTTGPMGYGNVFISLALAEEQLTKLGITQPTAEQIQAALAGGSVTTGTGSTAVTTQLAGVLVLRTQGQGWGQVAQSLGVNLRTAIMDARAGMDANETAETGQPEEMVHPQASARATDKVADRFATLAGSEDNATALVKGLHDGTAVSLTTTTNGQTSTTTFTPATGQMGFGAVDRSLKLAQEDLAKLGITQPTSDQLVAALNGGSVTTGSGSTAVTTNLTGVLVLRSQGQSWTQIAQTLGVNVQSAAAMEMHTALAQGGDRRSHHERMGAPERNEPQATASVASQAIAAASIHPDTAASLHTDLASSAHPDVSAISNRPDMGAKGRPDIGAGARPDVGVAARPEIMRVERFVRPDIPARPMVPGRH